MTGRTRGRVVVVGAGAAGIGTADALRREGFTDRITVLGEEAHLPYDRPPLSKKVLSGAWGPEQNSLRPDTWFADHDVELLAGRRASGLDVAERRVRLSTGEVVDYDVVVLATGVRARPLPAAAGLSGVHTVRSFDDSLRLKTDLDAAASLVVVGAGFLGMEIAAVARTMGREVTVVDPLPRPLGAVFGQQVGDLVADLHRGRGVRLLTGRGVAGLQRTPDRRATGLTLTDGSLLPADCIVVAIGAVPDTSWLTGSGLDLDGGVRCDPYCQAAPGVYAAGDIASWPSARYGRRMRVEHRLNATEQASTVARNVVHGNSQAHDPVPYFWSDQYDVRIQAHGVFSASSSYEVVDGDFTTGRFVLADPAEPRRLGVVGWNAAKLIAAHARAMQDDPVRQDLLLTT